MTVETEHNSKTHRGNGSSIEFPYDFRIPDMQSLRVYLFDETNNLQTPLSPGVFTITGVGEAASGKVTYPLAGSPLDNTKTLTIAREVPYIQPLDIHNQSGFYPEDIEDQLDRTVMQIQQVRGNVDGALRAQIGETFQRLPFKAALAGKALGFDSNGEPTGLMAIPLGAATWATEAEARAGVSADTLMSPLTTFQAIDERLGTKFPDDYSGTDTDKLQAFFNALATDGGTGRLTRWYDIESPIVVSSSAAPFVVEGVGKYVSGLRRAHANDFNVLDITASDFVLRTFGIDGGRTANPSTSHGLRVLGSRVQVTNLYVRDVGGRGILLTALPAGVTLMNIVERCHVDGTGGAQHGISLISQVNSVVAGNFVENVHSSTLNVGISLAGCSSTSVSANQIRNCFTSIQTAAGPAGEVGSNNQISDPIITSPNSTSGSGSAAHGIKLMSGSALSVAGASIDGGNAAGFIGVLVSNDPDGGAVVSFRASNCAGAASYALKLEGVSYSLATITSVFNVNNLFVHILGTSVNNVVLLGRKEGTQLWAPWTHVQNDTVEGVNQVQLLANEYQQFIHLADDEAYRLTVNEGSIGLLEVVTNGINESFYGFVEVSATPDIKGTVGANTAIGTTGLTTGTSNGVDGKFNVAAVEGRLDFKNRMGGGRAMLIRVMMQ